MWIHIHDKPLDAEKGIVWSGFYVTLPDGAFPSDDWDDATGSLLEMWGAIVVAQFTGLNDRFELPFMDGSYHLACRRCGDEVEVQGIDGHRPVRKTAVRCMPFAMLVKNVSMAISRLLYIARQQGVAVANVDTLQRLRRQLDSYSPCAKREDRRQPL